jgi:hypothetical protein
MLHWQKFFPEKHNFCAGRLATCGCVYFLKKKSTVQKKDSRHIKLVIHAWSTKCRWN